MHESRNTACLTVVGVLFTACGCFTTAVASCWQKTHRRSRLERYKNTYIPLTTNLLNDEFDESFLVGVFFWIIGNALHIIGLLFAPATLLGPVNALGLVYTVWLAWSLLDEPMTWKVVIATLGVVAGIGLCMVAIANVRPYNVSMETVLRSWNDAMYWYFALFLIAASFVCTILMLTMNRKAENDAVLDLTSAEHSLDQNHSSQYGYTLTPAHRKMHSIILATLAGICGSQTVCEIKELQVYWMAYMNSDAYNVMHLGLFLAIGVLILGAISQFPLLNAAMNCGSASVASAVYHVTWCFFSVAGSSIKFREYENLSLSQLELFTFGLIITLVSTYFVSMTWDSDTDNNELFSFGPLQVVKSDSIDTLVVVEWTRTDHI